MREITISGYTFRVPALTRGDIKALRAGGINLNQLRVDQVDEAVDAVFVKVFSPDEIRLIDAMENPDALRLWDAVLIETYGSRSEEKNCSSSGPGTPTRSESDTAGAA